MAESVNALFKTELHRNPAALAANGGHWKGLDDLEIATFGWVAWFDDNRLHSELGDLTPAEIETAHYRQPAQPTRLRVDHGFRLLIRDGAGQFTKSFDDAFAGSGINAIRIPPRSPQANAYAERWVRTLRHELLDRTIIWNEKQLRTLVVEYIDRYNSHRPHRGIDQRAPNDEVDVVPIRPGQRIERHITCVGLINEYRTAA